MKKPEKLPYQTVLAINTAQKDEIVLSLIVEDRLPITAKQPSRAQDLQVFIDSFLRSHSVEFKDIEAIAVYRIADSLTGTRMGIATANTLGFLLDIPIIELDTENFEDGLLSIQSSGSALKTVRQSLPLN